LTEAIAVAANRVLR